MVFNLVKIKKKYNNIAVFTAIIGDYDRLLPHVATKGVDFVCFTDNPKLYSPQWKIVKVSQGQMDPTRKARQIKILPHKFLPNYRYTLWIDANILLKCTAKNLFSMYMNGNSVVTFNHSARNCIYKEADACIQLKKDDPSVITHQMDKYKKENYPRENGLVETGVLLRDHYSPKLNYIMEQWWKEIVNHSKRDQLSFNYIAWKYNLNHKVIKQGLRNIGCFKIKNHIK